MNIQLPVQMDKPEFLAWVEKQEARYELSEGRVVMMVGASLAHGLIVASLIAILKGQVDPKEYSVVPDYGLELGSKTLRYPDIVIDCASGDRRRRTATAPILLGEAYRRQPLMSILATRLRNICNYPAWPHTYSSVLPG